MNDTVKLPGRTRELLENLIRERERINQLIEATVQATRAALDVPDGWQLTNLEQGFVAPQEDEPVG